MVGENSFSHELKGNKAPTIFAATLDKDRIILTVSGEDAIHRASMMVGFAKHVLEYAGINCDAAQNENSKNQVIISNIRPLPRQSAVDDSAALAVLESWLSRLSKQAQPIVQIVRIKDCKRQIPAIFRDVFRDTELANPASTPAAIIPAAPRTTVDDPTAQVLQANQTELRAAITEGIKKAYEIEHVDDQAVTIIMKAIDPVVKNIADKSYNLRS